MGELNIKEALRYTELSVEVYDENGGNPIQWEYVTSSKEVLGETDSGYYGALYKRVVINEQGVKIDKFAISHRGTDDLADMTPNLLLAWGDVSLQHEEAYRFVQILKDSEDIDLLETAQVGHSLGGGLAKLVGMAVGSKNIWAVNSPGVEHLRDEMGFLLDDIEGRPAGTLDLTSQDYRSEITEINATEDLVSKVGSSSGTVYTYDSTDGFVEDYNYFSLPKGSWLLANHSAIQMHATLLAGMDYDDNPEYFDEVIQRSWDGNIVTKTSTIKDGVGGIFRVQDQYLNLTEYTNKTLFTQLGGKRDFSFAAKDDYNKTLGSFGFDVSNGFDFTDLSSDNYEFQASNVFSGYNSSGGITDYVLSHKDDTITLPEFSYSGTDISLGFESISTGLYGGWDSFSFDDFNLGGADYVDNLVGFPEESFDLSNHMNNSFYNAINSVGTASNHASPLTFDLDGDGVELTHIYEGNVFFDIDNDDFAERVGWVSADDGQLALDRDGNGNIDNITELFGDYRMSAWDELGLLDSNADGLINSSDVRIANDNVNILCKRVLRGVGHGQLRYAA